MAVQMVSKLLTNASSNLLQLIINLIVTFIMAPVYLRMMGHYDYGLKEIVLSVAGYMGLMAIGMRPTVSRFVARFNAVNDRPAVLSVYASSFVFMSFVGLIAAAIFLIWGLFFPQTLAPDSEHIKKYQLFLLLVSVNMLLSFPMHVAEHFLEGLQKFYLKNMINIAFTIVIAAVCYSYLTVENALIFVMTVGVISAFLKLLIFCGILSLPSIGGWTLRFSHFSFSTLKEMIVFGSKSFIQGLAQMVNQMSDRVVIGAVLGPAAVPSYTIPATLLRYVNMFTMTSTQVFMPLFSELNAIEQQEKIRRVYLLSSKYMVSLVVAMSVGIAIIGGPFVDVWMPGEFDPLTVNAIIILLALHMIMHRLNPFSGHYLLAIDQHGFLAKVFPIGAVINLILSIVLVTQIGLVGIAIGTLVPAFFLFPVILVFTSRHLGISVVGYIMKCIVPAILPAFIMGSVVAYLRFSWVFDSYSRIIVAILLGFFVYIASFLVISFGKDEIDLLKRLSFKKVRRKK